MLAPAKVEVLILDFFRTQVLCSMAVFANKVSLILINPAAKSKLLKKIYHRNLKDVGPWFMTQDVCGVLGINKYRDALLDWMRMKGGR